jgi:hypothetical protein
MTPKREQDLLEVGLAADEQQDASEVDDRDGAAAIGLGLSAADKRDSRAKQADAAAQARDEGAARRDHAAFERDRAAAAREDEAADWMARAHRRLIWADGADARRWAGAIAAVEAARATHAVTRTEATQAALQNAEVLCEAETERLMMSGIARDDVRRDLMHAAHDLEAAATDRRRAAQDRAKAEHDRQLAASDRDSAHTARQQAAIDRARDPFADDPHIRP